MKTIFFYEAFAEEAEALQQFLPDSIEAGFTDQTIQEAGHSTPPAPIISTRTQSIFPLAWADQLNAIITRSTGYDHVRAYRQATGVQVPAGYLPFYCARAVAEQAMLLWMALLRKLPRQIEQFRSFHRDGLTGYECQGKHLLVAGVGNIGSQVVEVAQGLGMEVRGIDPVQRHDHVTYVDWEEGLAWADIVVCAMNLTEENPGIFTQALLNQCHRGTLFINIARGELSPATELLPLIESGHFAGVGLDVYDAERELAVALRSGQTSDHAQVQALQRLARHDNVILTPHNAFNTHESVQRKCEQTIQQLKQFLETGQFLWAVPT